MVKTSSDFGAERRSPRIAEFAISLGHDRQLNDAIYPSISADPNERVFNFGGNVKAEIKPGRNDIPTIELAN